MRPPQEHSDAQPCRHCERRPWQRRRGRVLFGYNALRDGLLGGSLASGGTGSDPSRCLRPRRAPSGGLLRGLGESGIDFPSSMLGRDGFFKCAQAAIRIQQPQRGSRRTVRGEVATRPQASGAAQTRKQSGWRQQILSNVGGMGEGWCGGPRAPPRATSAGQTARCSSVAGRKHQPGASKHRCETGRRQNRLAGGSVPCRAVMRRSCCMGQIKSRLGCTMRSLVGSASGRVEWRPMTRVLEECPEDRSEGRSQTRPRIS